MKTHGPAQSVLSPQFNMWKCGEHLFGQNHKHSNKHLSMEDVERILDLPIHEITDEDSQMKSSYSWDVLPSAWAGEHGGGTTDMLDYNMMGMVGMINQHEGQSRGRRTDSLSSYSSSAETNSWDGMDFFG